MKRLRIILLISFLVFGMPGQMAIAKDTNTASLGFDETYLELLKQFGAVEDEIHNLDMYIESLSDYYADPEVSLKLEELTTRLLAFAETMAQKEGSAGSYQPSEEKEELISLLEELIAVARMKVEFALTFNGVEKPYTIRELLELAEYGAVNFDGNEVELILLTENDGFLMDMIINGDFMENGLEEVVDEAFEGVSDIAETDTKYGDSKTTIGGELPKTGKNDFSNLFIGFLTALLGSILSIIVRNGKSEINKKL